VTVVAVLGATVNTETEKRISGQIDAAYVIDGKDQQPFRADEGDELAGLAGVTAASQVRSESVLLQGKEKAISGIDPATIGHFYRFKWSAGSQRTLAKLAGDGAIVTKSYAEDQHLAVGRSLSVKTASGERHTLVVRGIYSPPKTDALLGDVSIAEMTFDATFPQPKNSLTFLDANAAAGPAIEAAVRRFGDATYHTGASYPHDATKDMNTFVAMLYVLLGFSGVVSLFRMVNTMVLSVFERIREIGMLRTIGMTRRQSRQMIRHESIITALIGAALGVGLGLFLSVVVAVATPDASGMTIPFVPVVAFTLVAALAGVTAAILPARRASRLNVLDALQYE
jgi:putative ABC transport system permease protein